MACKRSSVQVRYPPLPKRRSHKGLRRFLLTQICITFRANSICITLPNFGSDTTCGSERAFLEPPTPKSVLNGINNGELLGIQGRVVAGRDVASSSRFDEPETLKP
jgi:hypothetical protein